jgi:ribonuclease BN (tRNA processing enzyme)
MQDNNLPTPPVPAAIKKYAASISHPVALIGCRTSEMSLDCCEYDLAVFAEGSNQVLQVGGHAVELVHVGKDHIVDLGGMVALNDKFMLSSSRGVTPEKYRKALKAAGKKSLISSLFYQQRMNGAKNPTVAAMWLKVAAYEFIAGSLALSGSRPMPLHEPEQIRQADAGGISEGVQAAFECIGTERATRPAISRSLEAINELKSNDYDRDLVMSKIRHLLDRRMLADCYYYAGKVAGKSLTGRSDTFHGRYSKLVQLALDLTSDLNHLQKLQRDLFRAANSGLRG